MAKVAPAERLEFGRFFSVEPANGLMVAFHKKDKYEEGDVLAELINISYGRDAELGLFGGFANGIGVKYSKKIKMTAEAIGAGLEELEEETECLVKRPGIAVYEQKTEFEGADVRIYYVFTCDALLTCGIRMNIMPRAEADFYRRMFASALPIGNAASKANTASEQSQAKADVNDIKAEGERLIKDHKDEMSAKLEKYDNDLYQMYAEFNGSGIEQLYRIKSNYRSKINDTGYQLSACIRKFSDAGEKLVHRGASVTFIREMIQAIKASLEEAEIAIELNLGDFETWKHKYNIPGDIKALSGKWEEILNSHPEVAAVRLKEAREAETKRVNELIHDLEIEVVGLQADESNRRKTAEQAASDYKKSAETLDKRIADVEAKYDGIIKDCEERQGLLKQQKTDCEQRIRQANEEFSKTFFLAFSKKKALQVQIDELTRQCSQYDQQIGELAPKIEETGSAKLDEVERVRKAHQDLKDAMNKARARLKQLPKEIADAERELENALKRRDEIPNMSMKELEKRPPKRVS